MERPRGEIARWGLFISGMSLVLSWVIPAPMRLGMAAFGMAAAIVWAVSAIREHLAWGVVLGLGLVFAAASGMRMARVAGIDVTAYSGLNDALIWLGLAIAIGHCLAQGCTRGARRRDS